MPEKTAPLRRLTTVISAPPGRAVEPIASLVTAHEHARKTGRFFRRGREIEPPASTRDQAVQQRLREESARLAGLPG